MYSVNETANTRDCDLPGCDHSLSIAWGQAINEALAIALASWLTVSSEIVTPDGIQIASKTFCSTTCLKAYIDSVQGMAHES